VLAAVGAVAGYLLGSGGSDSGESAEPLANSASAGTIGLSFPASWKRVSEQPDIPGMSFEEPVVLAPAGRGRSHLVAGQVAAGGPALLPAKFVARLPGGAPEGEPVRLNGMEALRYDSLAPRGLDGKLQLFAVPTNRGVATVACVAGGARAADFRRDCESVATTLELAGAKAYPLGPTADYARTLSDAMARLDKARGSATKKLQQADNPDEQAAAAKALSAAYLRAGKTLAGAEVSPTSAAANRALSRALKATALAYLRAANAAQANDGDAYAAARSALKEANASASRAQSQLNRLGYDLS
jgi:hypothetical protein